MSKHYADSWLFRCADDRYNEGLEFEKGLKAILSDAKINVAFGPMTPFGNSLRFANKDFQAYMHCEIETARHLGIKKIVFIDHLDCGAFKLAFGDLSLKQEKKEHIIHIDLAREYFAKNAPEMKFTAYLQLQDPNTLDFDKFEVIN